MAHRDSDGTIVNRWMVRARKTDVQVAPEPDPHEVGVVNFVGQSFARDNGKGRNGFSFKRALITSGLNMDKPPNVTNNPFSE